MRRGTAMNFVFLYARKNVVRDSIGLMLLTIFIIAYAADAKAVRFYMPPAKTFPMTTPFPLTVAVDPFTGGYWVADPMYHRVEATPRLDRMDKSTGASDAQVELLGVSLVVGLTIDPVTGNFFVFGRPPLSGGNLPERIYEYAPAGGAPIRSFDPPVPNIVGLSRNPTTGNLFAGTRVASGGRIIEFTTEGDLVREIDFYDASSAHSLSLQAVAFDSISGNYFAISHDGLYEVPSAGGPAEQRFMSFIRYSHTPLGMDFDAMGRLIVLGASQDQALASEIYVLERAAEPVCEAPVIPSAQIVRVSPFDMNGLEVKVTGLGVVDFVEGPAVPPLGSGSVEMWSGTIAPILAQIVINEYSGMPLSEISVLMFSTYVSSWGGVMEGVTPAFRMDLDLDGDGLIDDTLSTTGWGQNFNCPTWTSGILNTWQTWDLRNGVWSSALIPSMNRGYTKEPLDYYHYYLRTQLPYEADPRILNISIGLGPHEAWAGHNGNVDNVVVGTSQGITLYDFEPCPGPGCNNAPVLDPIGNQTVAEGQPLEFAVTASDPNGGDVLTLSASNLPLGATFEAATGVFSWTPGYDQAGNYENVEFSVVDNGDPIEVDVELITITVGDVNRAPVFVAIGPKDISENETLTFAVQARDPDGNDVGYTAASLPSGANFDATTQTFSWTPDFTQEGNYTVNFYASDDGIPNLSTNAQVLITVGDVPTALELADTLVDIVTSGDLELPQEVENSYMANLKKLQIFLEGSKVTPAVNQLEAFIHKIEQDMAHATISTEEGGILIALANDLIALLSQ